jgi:hypothetical protein
VFELFGPGSIGVEDAHFDPIAQLNLAGGERRAAPVQRPVKIAPALLKGLEVAVRPPAVGPLLGAVRSNLYIS